MRKIILLLLFCLFSSPAFARLDFDGVAGNNNKISLGTSDNIGKENGAFTFYWYGVADSAGTSGAGRFISRGTPATNNIFDIQFNVTTDVIRFGVVGATPLIRDSGANFFTAGIPQVLIVTWTGSLTATTVHMYLNGVEEDSYGTTTNGVTPTDTVGMTTLLGNRNSDTAREFDGQFYETAYWNRVLSAAEITQLSTVTLRYMPLHFNSGLQFYYTFDQGPAGSVANNQTIIDITGNINGAASAAGLTWQGETKLSYPEGIIQ